MKKIYIIFLLFITSYAYSQDLPDIIPQTPETASISKFQATPVSYYTGIPDISIPIYNLEGRSLSAPISLSYHAGGIRVNEQASDTGLGWSLSTGGQITRAMKGMPDERFYLTTTDKRIVDFEALSTTLGDQEYYDRQQIINNFKNGINDLEPDQFNFSFMGYSGKFMFNQVRTAEEPYGQIVMLPESDVKIIPIMGSTHIDGWEVITMDGTKFIFNAGRERVASTQSFNVDRKGGILYAPTSSPAVNYYTTWKLASITTHTGDSINFEYQTFNLSECSFGSETYNGLDTQQTLSDFDYESHTTLSSNTTTTSSRITKITSSKGSVEFIYANRNDIGDTDARRLIEIIVKNSNATEILKVSLAHSYFQSAVPTGSELIAAELVSCGSGFNPVVDTKRLKLDGLTFTGVLGNPSTHSSYAYQFDYNTVPLPHKKSYAQDFWGFYNGSIANQGLIPTIPVENYPNEQITNDVQADRYVRPQFAQAAVLTKVTYPEGGYQEFTYENNRARLEHFDQDELDFISPPEINKELNLKTSVQAPYANNEIDPASGLTIYRYKKTFEIGADALNNGEVDINVYSNICYGANGEIIFGSYCDVSGGISKQGQIDPVTFSFSTLSGTNYLNSVNLTPGVYEAYVNVIATDFPANGGYLDLKLNWSCPNNENIINETGVEDLFLIGGLRIQEITTYNDDTTPVTRTTYGYDNNMTSNISIPVFADFMEVTFGTCPAEYKAGVHQFTSAPVHPLITNQGGFVGYLEVTESIAGYDTNTQSYTTLPDIRNIYTFSSKIRADYRGSPVDYEWMRGIPLIKDLNAKQIEIDSIQFSFNPDQFATNNFSEGYEARNMTSQELVCQAGNFSIFKNRAAGAEQKFIQFGGWSHMVNKKQIQKEINGDLITETLYEYNTNIEQPTKITTTLADGEQRIEHRLYSSTNQIFNDLPATARTALEDQNRKEIIKSWVVNENGEVLSTQLSNYSATPFASNIYLPESTSFAKGDDTNLEERIKFHSFTNYGQPREVSKTNGARITYIWGYNFSYPVAQIQNATYADVVTVFGINTLNTIGINGITAAQSNTLRNGLPNALITTFTYDPLVGVTSVTDPKGYKMTYHYDAFSRLQFVKDADNNLISESQYHYKNQN